MGPAKIALWSPSLLTGTIFASFILLQCGLVSALSLDWLSRVGVQKRDDTNSTTPPEFIPVRVNIDLSYDNGGRYVIPTIMGSQLFNFTFTTGNGIIYVAGSSCAGCGPVKMYNQSQSTTMEPFLGSKAVPFFNGTANASVIKDDCSLTTSNGSAWVYPNQTIAVMNQVTKNIVEDASGAVVGTGISGMLGLGTNRGEASGSAPSTPSSSSFAPTFNDSIYGQWFQLHPTGKTFAFGLQLLPPIIKPQSASNASSGALLLPSNNSAGVIHWLRPDTSAYDQSQVSWTTVNDPLSTSTNPSDPQDWTVQLDGWAFTYGTYSASLPIPIVANVDPLYAGIYFPLSYAAMIHDSIQGAFPQPLVSTLGSLAQTWSIPCDANPSLGIIVGSQTFLLNRDSLVIDNGDGTCTSGIEAWTDTTLNQYTFGARFISTIYVIFQIPRDGSPSIGFAPRAVAGSSHKSLNIGAIVGGTVGGVAFLSILALGLVFYFKRRRAARSPVDPPYEESDEHKSPYSVEPFVYNPQSPTSPSSHVNASTSQIVYVNGVTVGSPPDSASSGQLVFLPSQFGTPGQTPLHSPSAPLLPNAGLHHHNSMHVSNPPPAYEDLSVNSIQARPRDVKGAGGSTGHR